MALGTLLLGYFMMVNSTIGTDNVSIDVSVDAVGILLMISGAIQLKAYSNRFAQLFRCAIVMIPISVFFVVYQLKLWEGFDAAFFGVLYQVLDQGWIILFFGLQYALFGAVADIASQCELFVLQARLKICIRIGLVYALIALAYWMLCILLPVVGDYSYYIRYLLYDLIIFFQSFYLFRAWREIAFV